MAIDIRCVTQKDPYVMQHRRFLNKSQIQIHLRMPMPYPPRCGYESPKSGRHPNFPDNISLLYQEVSSYLFFLRDKNKQSLSHILLLITDTPETNCPVSNLLYPHLFPVRLSNTQRSNRPSANNNTHYSHQNDDVFPVRSTYQSVCLP